MPEKIVTQENILVLGKVLLIILFGKSVVQTDVGMEVGDRKGNGVNMSGSSWEQSRETALVNTIWVNPDALSFGRSLRTYARKIPSSLINISQNLCFMSRFQYQNLLLLPEDPRSYFESNLEIKKYIMKLFCSFIWANLSNFQYSPTHFFFH